MHSAEGRIDSIAQSWAVLSEAVPTQYAERAMDAVRTHLLNRGSQTLLLLTPPFDRADERPRLHKGIPDRASVRTAANIRMPQSGSSWLQPDSEMATKQSSFSTCSIRSIGRGPRSRSRRYRAEPYVIAGDVCANGLHTAPFGVDVVYRSGWMDAIRAGLGASSACGAAGCVFEIDPCIPSSWGEYAISWRIGSTLYEIFVSNPQRRCRGIADATSTTRRSIHAPSPLPAMVRRTRSGIVLGDRKLSTDGAAVRRVVVPG